MRNSIRNLLCCLLLVAASVCSADEQLRQRIEGWTAGYPAVVNDRPIANVESIAAFYVEHRYQPLWLKDRKLTDAGRALLEAIHSSRAEGLQPADYHSQYLHAGFAQKPQLALAEYDILMTDAFITLAQHLTSGKVNPEALTTEWKSNRRSLNVAALLERVRAEQEVQQILHSLRHNPPRYARSKAALERLRNSVNQDWNALKLTPTIKPGASDSRVPAIRERLMFWGDLAEQGSGEIYDPALVPAVKQFQERHGLETDGVIGAETLRALNVTVEQRVRDLTVNLERWRWLKEDIGRRFAVVNIAAFDLRIYEDDKKIFQRPVIVGKDYRKTPVFSDLIRHIVFNPTWTVPHKLAVQDKLPEIQADPSYLERMGFTLYHIGTSSVADPSAIDWSSLSRRNFPFRLVQGPGPLNALGQVKFMFPNPYDVYLHDTPSRELFLKSERAFSSGCIRLSDPLALAQLLLNNKKGWDAQKIAAVIESGKTTTVYLDNPMPVHIEYWTAWVDSEDKLHFRKDIYGRDGPLWQALIQPL